MKSLFNHTVSYIKKHPRLDLAALALALAVFLTITFINAPRASIWFDEAFSVYLTNFSFFDIAKFTATDVHPPMYYWALKAWSALFGTTELAYRSLSILFGAGALTSVFFLTRKMFGRKVAWTSLLFLSVSPMLIRYSDEARMNTMAALISVVATHFLIRATETKKRSDWITYAVLVSVGMWTHYFTALVWLAHWAWRLFTVRKKGDSFKVAWKKFFTKEWVITYAVAVGVFLPWLPFMVYQLGVVQGGGFWIGPVTVNTFGDYISSYFYYLWANQAQGWLGLAVMFTIALTIFAVPRAYRALRAKEQSSYVLVASLAWVPPVLLFLASMPPLQSSFVERYLVPSIVFLSVFLAVTLVVGLRNLKPLWRTLPIVLIFAMMVFGVTNVYKYGNYNKNSNTNILTRQAVDLAKAESPNGIAIVTSSPWVYYEAAPYATSKYPVYFIDKYTSYDYGSLDMLKGSDKGKIKDLEAFSKNNPVIWYLGGTSADDVAAPADVNWQKIKTVKTTDPITGKSVYKATQYRISAE